jgi:hypothetical protein
MDRLYCTLAELMADLNLHGARDEARMVQKIRAASRFIEGEIGQFIPSTETKKIYPAMSGSELLTPPILAAITVQNYDTTLGSSDFRLHPGAPMWVNGPYSGIVLENEGDWDSDGNDITARWGMYELSEAVGLSGTLAAAGTATLAVTDGSKLSPGMALLMESEQLLVTGTNSTATDSTADLAVSVDGSSESVLTLTDGTKVAIGEVIKVDFEQMKVLDITGNDVLVERSWNGSAITAHSTGKSVYVYRTFDVKRGTNGTTAAAHSSVAIYRYLAPADVNYLCVQIAALMMKKAETQFVGRGGNDDMGTGYWLNEFPKNQIENVKSNYFWGGA